MKNEIKTKVMIAGAAFCAALFLFSGFMLCREYFDQKQSAEAFEEVAELVKEEPVLPVLELESGPEPVQEERPLISMPMCMPRTAIWWAGFPSLAPGLIIPLCRPKTTPTSI